MRSALLRFLAALAVSLACCAASSPAVAADVQVRAGLVGQASSWPSDGAFGASSSLGVRFKDLITVYGLGRVGVAAVDDRMLTLVSIGATVHGRIGRVRPFGRFGLVHQHEETWAAVDGSVFEALFGVGDGIRHRGGFEWALGADVPLTPTTKKVHLFAIAEALITYFPDSRGPAVYGGGTLGLGMNYAL